MNFVKDMKTEVEVIENGYVTAYILKTCFWFLFNEQVFCASIIKYWQSFSPV